MVSDAIGQNKSYIAELRDLEICNECGKSVKPGSGKFVNRIPDLNDYVTRREIGKPYPQGGYTCDDCEHAYYEDLKEKGECCPRCESLNFDDGRCPDCDYSLILFEDQRQSGGTGLLAF